MIPFFITIDTEGDALWDDPKIEDIKTENVLFIPRFQELCEKYGMIPIWLTDYEIIMDERFVSYIKEKNKAGLCEVGIHVHARNNPPLISLGGEKERGAAYLIEYPDDVLCAKFNYLKGLIEEKIECTVKTHRAGRWTINEKYIKVLAESGILYDCSVTPGIDWSGLEGITPGSKGSNYSGYNYGRQWIGDNQNRLIEYPVSVFPCDRMILPARLSAKGLARAGLYYVKKQKIWLRPNTNHNINEMKYLLRKIKKENLGYAEFMIHSSEFMPGGGPKHQGKAEVDQLFRDMESLFAYANELGFEGHTFETWERAANQRDGKVK